jgi:hypothetical protein
MKMFFEILATVILGFTALGFIAMMIGAFLCAKEQLANQSK